MSTAFHQKICRREGTGIPIFIWKREKQKIVEKMIALAIEQLRFSYTPYSGFKVLRKFWSCRSIAGDSRQPLKECFVNEEKMEVGKNYSKVF